MKPHVLPSKTLVTVIRKSWTTLWMTRIGGCVPLQRLNVDAQVIGKFFQELMALELHAADPRWRHPDAPRSPKDPDFVFLEDSFHNFELKMSGQVGGRAVFGNRCSSAGFASPDGKSRDTWLLTINYTDTRINLIRFGYVLGEDWIGQKAATGNASRLHKDVYSSKLRVLKGSYQRFADPRILKRVRSSYHTIGRAAEAGCPEAKAFLEADYY